jgi:hydrogenase expression/formation protein HypC
MCLGIPGQITEIWHNDQSLPFGKVNFGGLVKEVCLVFTPAAAVGDYVIVHVGFAISRINEQEAQETLTLLKQMGELEELAGGRP